MAYVVDRFILHVRKSYSNDGTWRVHSGIMWNFQLHVSGTCHRIAIGESYRGR